MKLKLYFLCVFIYSVTSINAQQYIEQQNKEQKLLNMLTAGKYFEAKDYYTNLKANGDSLNHKKDIPINQSIEKDTLNIAMLHDIRQNIPYKIADKPSVSFNDSPIYTGDANKVQIHSLLDWNRLKIYMIMFT